MKRSLCRFKFATVPYFRPRAGAAPLKQKV